MIQISPQMRILVAIKPVDFRKGIDGLAGICRLVLKSDPFSGYVFVFRNRRGTAIKILVYDGQGYWLCQKTTVQWSFSLVAGKGAGGTVGCPRAADDFMEHEPRGSRAFMERN